MFGRNIDFFAVLSISITMLAVAEVRSWHLAKALHSIRVENAIQVERCPISGQVLSNFAHILH
jgi:hypothetical protein